MRGRRGKKWKRVRVYKDSETPSIKVGKGKTLAYFTKSTSVLREKHGCTSEKSTHGRRQESMGVLQERAHVCFTSCKSFKFQKTLNTGSGLRAESCSSKQGCASGCASGRAYYRLANFTPKSSQTLSCKKHEHKHGLNTDVLMFLD